MELFAKIPPFPPKKGGWIRQAIVTVINFNLALFVLSDEKLLGALQVK